MEIARSIQLTTSACLYISIELVSQCWSPIFLAMYMQPPRSKPQSQWIYDVFINFRGADTRGNFVSHLYAALTNAGINTFLDDENLEKGKVLGPELMRAIEGSQIAIVVFSENYVRSGWCLDELVLIMQCHAYNGQVVMPVFNGTTPSKIRQYTFEKPVLYIDELDQRINTALHDASNLAGWDMSNYR